MKTKSKNLNYHFYKSLIINNSDKNSVKFFSQKGFTGAFRFFEFLSALVFAAVKPGQTFAALNASVFFCLTKQILLNAVIFYVL